MSGLHLFSLPLNMADLHRWSARRGLAGDEGLALHHLLSETFGKGTIQPFRMMVAPGAAQATLYGYGGADAATMAATARETGLPDALAVCDPTELRSKEMPAQWRVGRRLAFDLRARPVRRLARPAGVFPKGAEIDAFLLDALRRFPDGPPETTAVDRPERETVYLEWLANRLAGAARIEQARLTTYQRRVVQRGGKRRDGPDITVLGELVVEDAGAFARLLADGVGRHAAFGYGMLLLRPAK